MSQTEVTIDQRVAIAGQAADTGPRDVNTFLATEKLPFGQLISRVSGSDDKGKRPASATDITNVKNVAGTSFRSLARVSVKDSLPAGFNKEEAADIMREGRTFVQVEDPVTPDSDVFVRFTAKPQIQEIVFDAPLVTGNLIDGEINGEAITQVPFNTNNDTTVDDLATEIQSNVNVETAVRSGTDTVVVTSVQDVVVTLTNYVVTGGASQAVATVSETQQERAQVSRGSFRSDSDSGTAAQLSEAKWRTTAAADELAVVEIDV